MNRSLSYHLDRSRKIIDKSLNSFLPSENKKPRVIHKAMRYSIFAGGKRFRPTLVLAAAELCGGKKQEVLPAACALEFIHTYSLIHDDLPAMDDDDLRRGKPTNHVIFGEDIAILAGDALLTLAFDLLAKNALKRNIKTGDFAALIRAVVKGAGTSGMIGGQVADIKSDKGRWKKFLKTPNSDGMTADRLLPFIHRKKTAALITASLETGAILAEGSVRQRKALSVFGNQIGLAFQIKDDILDRVGNKKKLGKKGSDSANQKLTYPVLYGIPGSIRRLDTCIKKAHDALSIFGDKASVLHSLADFIRDRDH